MKIFNLFLRLSIVLFVIFSLNGCLLTKVVTVPMRVGGAVVSVVPVAGDIVDEGVDAVADTVDKVPL